MTFRVMVVDDTLYMRTLLIDYLKQGKFIIAGEAENGLSAIQQYRQLQPDLTFLNMVMPGCNGLEAMRAILNWDPHAKIIICSAATQANIIFDAIQAGAVDYITKPFTQERIISAAQRYKLLKR